jgi:hypothetical protein
VGALFNCLIIMNKKLTAEELVNLVANVYGLIDSNGVMFYSHSSLIGERTLFLTSPEDSDIEVLLEGGELSNDGGTLTVVLENGELEQFTPLVLLSLAKDIESFLIA